MMKLALASSLLALVGLGPTCSHGGPPGCRHSVSDPAGDVAYPGIDMNSSESAHFYHQGPFKDPAVDVTFVTPWPPDMTAYSWFITVAMHSEDPDNEADPGVTIEVTREHHDGVDQTLVTGIDPSKVALAESDTFGVNVFFAEGDNWYPRNSTYAVETGYLETSLSTFQQDELPDVGDVRLCP